MALNTLEALESLTFNVTSIDRRAITTGNTELDATVVTFEEVEQNTLSNTSYEFLQSEELTEAGVAVQPYGAIIINELAPTAGSFNTLYLYIKTDGTYPLLKSAETIGSIMNAGVGETVRFTRQIPPSGGNGGGGSVG